MDNLMFSLFGKFRVQYMGEPLPLPGKSMELLGYLLLFPNRPHHRETLANQLWSGDSSVNSKKHLRYVIWQTRDVFGSYLKSVDEDMLFVENDWIQIQPKNKFWLDAEIFNQTYDSVQGIAGQKMNRETVKRVAETLTLYRGDLLEGWYQDWCLFEREHYQNKTIVMLGKMIDYFEAFQLHENAFAYGARVLRIDPLHERTHRQLMRMHFRTGNRTAALRQYQRFVVALEKEMGVEPVSKTRLLYEQIRNGRLDDNEIEYSKMDLEMSPQDDSLSDLLEQINKLQIELQKTKQRVEEEINKFNQESKR